MVVTGASGGVGGVRVQLARRRGARTVAIASESTIGEVAATTGADHVLAHQEPDVAEKVFDLTGGGAEELADVAARPLFARLFDVIRRGGHSTTAGAIGGPIVDLDVCTLYLRDLTMHICTVLPPEAFAHLARYIEDGAIPPIVSAAFPLADMHEAQTTLMKKDHIGAIVIAVG